MNRAGPMRVIAFGLLVFIIFSGVGNAQNSPMPLLIVCGDAMQSPNAIEEIRIAASIAASEQLPELVSGRVQQFQGDFESALTEVINEIEFIGFGPNRECRETLNRIEYPALDKFAQVLAGNRDIPITTLSKLYYLLSAGRARDFDFETPIEGDDVFVYFSRLYGDIQFNLAAAHEASSLELSRSNANVLLEAMSDVLLFGIAPDQALSLFDLDLARFEEAACGEIIEFYPLDRAIFKLDGSIRIKNQLSFSYPIRELAAHLWQLTILLIGEIDEGLARFIFTTAETGCSHELREVAAEVYARYLALDPGNSDELYQLANAGRNMELRKAAADSLASYLSQDAELDNIELQQLAMEANSEELRMAAGLAVGLRLDLRFQQGDLEADSLFSFVSQDGTMVIEGDIFQFASEHTIVNSELAMAVILPLSGIFNDN
jgi:hypothetical protein